MEAKRLTTRPMLQRTLTITKQLNEQQQQLTTNLTVPFWKKNWQRQSSTNSEGTNNINQSPRTATYITNPQKKFDFIRAQKLLQFELNRHCNKISKNIRYNPKFSIDLVCDLAQQLRRIIKTENLNSLRYKIIVLISIVQTIPNKQIHQSMTIVSRCLWNKDTDGSITVQTKLGYDMVAIATAFAVYTD